MPGPPQHLLNGNYYSSTEPPTETPSFPVAHVLTRSHMLCGPYAHFSDPLMFLHMSTFIHELSVFLTYPLTPHQVAGLVPAIMERTFSYVTATHTCLNIHTNP